MYKQDNEAARDSPYILEVLFNSLIGNELLRFQSNAHNSFYSRRTSNATFLMILKINFIHILIVLYYYRGKSRIL
jgi:hypothetical protein